MRPSRLLLTVAVAGALAAQQVPFLPVTGPNAPKGASFLYQDSRGGLFLGGAEAIAGLTYFDGTRFTVPLASGPPRMLITGMADDNEGGIWFCSPPGGGGVYPGGVYRALRGQIQKLFDGTPSLGMIAIARDVFLVNMLVPGKPDEAALMRIMKMRGVWKMDMLAKSKREILLQPDGLGNVLYPCAGGYCEVRVSDVGDWKGGTVLAVTRHSLAQAFPAVAVLRDRFGCIWMRGYAQAAYQCATDPRPVVLPYRVASDGQPGLAEMDDGSIVIPSFGRLAIGRPGNFHIMTAANGYPSFASFLVGKDGSIWLSNANGLFVFPSRLRMEFWTQRDGLDGNTWSVLPVGKNMLALAGDDVEILDDDRARWHPLVEFGGARHLVEATDHSVFVGSHSEGVMQMDSAGKILRRSAPAYVATLARGADGQIWSSGDMLARVSISGSHLVLQKASSPGPQSGGRDIKVDRAGGLWNCYAGGLAHLDAAGWHFLNPVPGSAARACNAVAIDLGGDIWCDANRFGVLRNPQSDRPVFQDSGMLAGRAHFLDIDGRGRIWLGTATGVSVADPEQAQRGEWIDLHRADGFPGNDTNQRSFFSDSDGSVWFGIDDSVVHLFPPSDLVHPSYAPSAFVSGFSFNGGPFQMADQVDGIPYGAPLTAHIGSLQIDRRSAMQLRYRIEPGQATWTASRVFDLALGELPWGTHRLEVQARLGDGPWSNSSFHSFEIWKPVWLSTSALLGYAFAGTLAAAGGQRWQRKRRKRTQTLLPGIDEWRAAALSPEFEGLKGKLLDGRFEVRTVIARGGFATVWEGADRAQGGRKCAVKIFRHELLDNSWMGKRFQQEVAALEQVNHPNVVGIFGHGCVKSGAPYLAMEFVEGKTLRDLLLTAKLTKRQTASYLRQTADALSEIHGRGICHRDVKPENLMIRSSAGPGAEVVLIDFSIAIVQDPDETMHGLSRAAGTLYYMAPEQAIGYANQSSDIYSLAKVLIEMLTGERLSTLLPDASIDLPARVRELLAELQIGLSADSIDLLASALEFDPSRRPSRAEDFGARIALDLDVEI